MAKTIHIDGIKSCGECPLMVMFVNNYGEYEYDVCSKTKRPIPDIEKSLIHVNCPLPNTPEDEAPGQFEFECVFHTYRNGAGSQMKIDHIKSGLSIAEAEQSQLDEITRRKMLLKKLYDDVKQRGEIG